MGNHIDESKPTASTRQMFGRTIIKSSVPEITRDNVVDVITKAEVHHAKNRSEIDYLYNYYKGKQPILNRIKEVRPEICNKIVENRANEIVSFKVGYLCGEPIQYVGRSGDESVTENIKTLNEYMFAEDKASKDEEVVEWQMIGGTAYRIVLPDEALEPTEDEAPFEMFTLDPRDTFIVYSSEIGGKRLLGCKCSDFENIDGLDIHRRSVYTKDRFYVIDNGIITAELPNPLGEIPIFEYPANNARLGAFEIVLPLLDALNNVESNRMDGMEQVIQAFIKFVNCDITADDFELLRSMGAIKVKSTNGEKADVDVVTNELNQDQSQTFKEDLYSSILTICGIPNRNGGTSTSDTGSAVLLRDGWSLAEARAKDSEHMFKRSEKAMLKLVLKICKTLGKLDGLMLKDISLKFTRRNYENIQSKAQVLVSMLQQEKIHPLLAFESSGLFIDPEEAYSMSLKYFEEHLPDTSDSELISMTEKSTNAITVRED